MANRGQPPFSSPFLFPPFSSLANGNTFIATYSQILEVNAAGKELLSVRDNICLTGAGKMVETDATGKILWECAVAGPCGATRLPNGNTLFANADGRCVVEVDRQGKEVWKKTTKGRPFMVRRY